MANVPAIVAGIIAGILAIVLIGLVLLWLFLLSPNDKTQAKDEQLAECKTLIPFGATGIPTVTLASGTATITWTAPTVDAAKVSGYKVVITPSSVDAVPGPTGFDSTWRTIDVSNLLTANISGLTTGSYEAWVAPVGKCGAFGPFVASNPFNVS